jgi:signal transduction histidine kinase/CheY-like chemotaxis protein
MAAVVADLVINKPLGLSPPGIEFKRAHLYDINPVGVGAMALASALSIPAHLGFFGPGAQAFSAVIALGVAFVTAPLIAWATKGRYYIAREAVDGGHECPPYPRDPALRRVGTGAHQGTLSLQRCVICEREYEGPDMAHCPAYQGRICSLCCTLDARCGDLCKPHASLSAQWSAALRWLLPRRVWPYLDTGLGHFLLLMLIIVPLLATLFGLLYHQEGRAVAQLLEGAQPSGDTLRSGFLKAYMALLVIAGIVAWWLVLAHKSRQVAQEESNRQTHLLMREIESHRQTDEALQGAKRLAEQARLAAEHANQAKSRYISAISHELRTPLNSILGYAQLMGEDTGVPPHRKQAVNVIRRGGEHLLSLIEGTLDIARIEAGKLTLAVKPMQFADCVHEMAGMFEPQALAKGLAFRFEVKGHLPELVRADEKRVRQILINLLGNAIKFTAQGQVAFRVRHAREMAHIDIEDTGPGLTADELAQVFEPFARGNSAGHAAPGAGLGLTIAKMLTDLMGGEMTVASTPGRGSVFRIKLFLPEVHAAAAPARVAAGRPRRGYEGARRKVLVVDNEEADRELLVQVLEPLGFELRTAASGHDALDLLAAGLRPDAILMDLAMPGIDGWETIRRLRRLDGMNAKVAVVSANAFDRNLDNDAGVRAEDFILKPVRHSELLDWLERQLGLRWLESAQPPVAAAPAPAPRTWAWPEAASLRTLQDSVQLGYFRGIMNQLDAIESAQPACAGFAAAMRELARQFQFEAMSRELSKAPVTEVRP